MPQDLTDSLNYLAQYLLENAREDADLRRHLRCLAQVILEQTPTHGSPLRSSGQPASQPSRERSLLYSQPPSALPCDAPIAVGSFSLRASSTTAAEPRSQLADRSTLPSDADLPVMESRCRLKAEATRWAAHRRRLLAEAAPYETAILPKDRALVAQAKALPDCFLWMCHPDGPSVRDHSLYQQTAQGFDNTATMLGLLVQILEAPDVFEPELGGALELLAEAQSGVRAAVGQFDDHEDRDQVQVFHWLKRTALEKQIYIHRYMRADDPADPLHAGELALRIQAFEHRLHETRDRARQRKKLLSKIRHKTSLLLETATNDPDEWTCLIRAVEALIASGFPPSNRELRELLLPVFDKTPNFAEESPTFRQVLRAIDRYLAERDDVVAPVDEGVAQSQELEEVHRLLSGREVVLIGGERRPASQQALEHAFGLARLRWIDTREHESIERFAPYVARPEVALVILAIRWSSHAFGEVKQFCEDEQKPLVRLPGGYNPNQVAAQILSQCSERLRGERKAS